MLKKIGVGFLAMMIAVSFLLGWDCSCLVYAAESTLVQAPQAMPEHCPMKHSGSEDSKEKPAKHDCQHCYSEKQARLVKPEPVSLLTQQFHQPVPYSAVPEEKAGITADSFANVFLDISPQFFIGTVLTATYSAHAPPARL